MSRTLVSQLKDYFETVNISIGPFKIQSESDGRAGNGSTHWRSLQHGGNTIGCLEDERGWASFTISPSGDLRDRENNEQYEFKSLGEAVKAMTSKDSPFLPFLENRHAK